MPSVSVVHLVWKPLAVDIFRRFLASYKQNKGGIDHELVVVFNGFNARHELGPYLELLEGIPYTPLLLKGRVQDIPAYYAAARSISTQLVCFLNSYSVLLDDDWLAKLYAAVEQDNVGLVGATGSHQSLYNSIKESMTAVPPHFMLRRWAGAVRRKWALTRYESYFIPFPNPHIRSNGFMLARELMLNLRHEPIRNKLEAMRFESGKDSLTRQIQATGRKVLVVGRSGKTYEPENWFESETFKSGEQSNLLIADNRTEQYIQSDAETRKTMTKMVWGK